MAKPTHNIRFTRIKTRSLGLLLNDDEKEKIVNSWVEEDRNNLLTLCRHYGIKEDPLMFYNLSLELAREFLPAQKKRGAKKKWSDRAIGILAVEMERLIDPSDHRGHGVAWAAKQLSRRPPWNEFISEQESSESSYPAPDEVLRKLYFEYKDSEPAELMRFLFGRHKIKNDIDGWKKRIAKEIVKKKNNF